MDIIGTLSINSQKVTLDKGHIILKPNEKITYIYFLIKGTVDYYNCLDHPREDVLIYRSKVTQTPIGWCGLFPPARSLNKIIIASEEAVFQRFEIEIFQKEIKLNLQNLSYLRFFLGPNNLSVEYIIQRIYTYCLHVIFERT